MRDRSVFATVLAAIPSSVFRAGPADRQTGMPPALMLLAPCAVLRACRPAILRRPPRLQLGDGIRTLGLDPEAVEQGVPKSRTFSVDEGNVRKE